MGQTSLQNDYIQHPKLHEEVLESRTYQEVIAASATDQNTMVVLPTGLGKTAVAILLAAHRLQERPATKILMLAPTRPLVEQHRDEFERCLDTETGIFKVLTGDTRPEKRKDVWKEIGCFFATPQVVENDIINGRIDLSSFSLVVFDEVHRATGDYPYGFVAEKYVQHGDDPRILGLTASPGGDRAKIEGVAERLFMENFEIRTEEDPDVRPYVQETETEWVKVSLDRNFKRVKRYLEDAQRTRLKELKRLGLLDSISNVSKKDLLQLRGKIGKRMNTEDDPKLYQGMSHVAAAMKVEHALELLETQGVKPLHHFFEKMKKDRSTKAARTLLEDEDFGNAVAVTEWMVNNDKEHPKLGKLKERLEGMEGEENAIVFTQFRDTVDLLHGKLQQLDGVEPVKFKGQGEDFSQTKQLEILDDFRAGTYNVLVSTSVGEEGLDIPAVDEVIFYEPIPSEIRTIQRSGRTGRQEEGKITVLMAEGTRDEAYYWSAKNREKKMKTVMEELDDGGAPTAGDDEASTTDAGGEGGGQATLDGYSEEDGIVIVADDRENRIMKELSRREVTVRGKRLEVGDFIVSDRCVVERKAADDFVSSLIDNRLFPQVEAMNDAFQRPILLIEGTDLYRHRDVHPNAIRGALASIALDYDTPILWSEDEDETVETLVSLAKREQEERDREVAIRGERSPRSERELQEYIVAGLPNVSTKLAERLLQRFGSVEAVYTATEDELKRVEGIGDEKASRIRDILSRSYGDG